MYDCFLNSKKPGNTFFCQVYDIRIDFLFVRAGAIYVSGGENVSASWKDYADEVQPSLSEATSGANISPQRFAASVGRPFVFVQCTWDLPADKCKQCLDILSINVTDIWVLRTEGQQKSYSCTVRYSNTSFMVVPFTPVSAPAPQSVETGISYPPSSRGEFFTCIRPLFLQIILSWSLNRGHIIIFVAKIHWWW
jgi:hypothetical protein